MVSFITVMFTVLLLVPAVITAVGFVELKSALSPDSEINKLMFYNPKTRRFAAS